MQLLSPLVTLLILIVTGLFPIVYSLTSSAITLGSKIANFTLGVILIIGGVYVYNLLNEIKQLQQNNNPLTNEKTQGSFLLKLPKICNLEDTTTLPELTPDQLHIMQYLFPKDYQLHVQSLQGGFNNLGVVRVIREITRGNIPDRLGYIVKYLKVEDIRKEKRAYEKDGILDRYPLPFIPGELRSHWPPDSDLGIADEESIGAVYYYLATRDEGNKLQTLRDIYIEQPFVEIKLYLEKLFDETLLPRWYKQSPSGAPKPLGGRNGIYGRLSRNRAKIQEHINKLLIQTSTRSLTTLQHIEMPFLPRSWQRHDFYNPVYWILNVLEPGQVTCFQTECRSSPIHGDLHMGNVLVERGRTTSVWLIDFPNAHTSRALVDFATMEADVKFNHLDESDCSWEEWLTFEEKLLTPLKQFHRLRPLTEPWQEDWEPTNEQLKKAWYVIQFLRERVVKHFLIGVDSRAYYLALLYATLPTVYRTHTTFQKQRALVSSAWMCEHLSS